VFQHHGTLDKMLGDGLTALFGAPEEDSQHALHSLEAAKDMQERLARLQQKWMPGPSGHFSMGIGLHTGEALVGNLGSRDRLEYTAIGETVKLAARLEAATEENRCSILLSRETAGEIPVHFPLRQVGVVSGRGIVQSMAVFTPQPSEPAKT
jgi:adenylate cyclase